jgi:uncharacterized protein YjcR
MNKATHEIAFRDWLKIELVTRGMSLKDLADEIGCSKQNIHQRLRKPTGAFVKDINAILDKKAPLLPEGVRVA